MKKIVIFFFLKERFMRTNKSLKICIIVGGRRIVESG